jgi:hypothetical protein
MDQQLTKEEKMVRTKEVPGRKVKSFLKKVVPFVVGGALVAGGAADKYKLLECLLSVRQDNNNQQNNQQEVVK